jgi:uncharacterized tellurite resistance protein B-like protein
MLWLSNSTLSRLRDQLRAGGSRASTLPPLEPQSIEEMHANAVAAELLPLTIAMYTMMVADGKTSTEEHEVLRGALRNLSENHVRSAHIDQMVLLAEQRVAEVGVQAALRESAQQLSEEAGRAEVAFILAAAIAFADQAIADQENDLLNTFAEHLGISETRAHELLDTLDGDLQAARANQS